MLLYRIGVPGELEETLLRLDTLIRWVLLVILDATQALFHFETGSALSCLRHKSPLDEDTLQRCNVAMYELNKEAVVMALSAASQHSTLAETLPELAPPYRLLLGPGPCNIDPRVFRALAAPSLGILTPR